MADYTAAELSGGPKIQIFRTLGEYWEATSIGPLEWRDIEYGFLWWKRKERKFGRLFRIKGSFYTVYDGITTHIDRPEWRQTDELGVIIDTGMDDCLTVKW